METERIHFIKNSKKIDGENHGNFKCISPDSTSQ